MNESQTAVEFYTPREELANRITHGLGVILSLAGILMLLPKAIHTGDPWIVVSFVLFGITLLLLYTSSTLYHTIAGNNTRLILRKIDHSAIYLLIAGTYTPFLLISLRGPWGWTMFGIIWTFAFAGIIIKVATRIRSKIASAILYIIMGWLGVLAVREMFIHVPVTSLVLLGAGGLAYTSGVAFYVWKSLKFHHAIWHLFVLAGSICHFFAVYFLAD